MASRTEALKFFVTKPGSIYCWKKCRKQLPPLKKFVYTATVTVVRDSWNVFSHFSWWTLCFRSNIVLQPKHVQWRATRCWPPQENKEFWAGDNCSQPIGLLERDKQNFSRSPYKFCLPFKILTRWTCKKKENQHVWAAANLAGLVQTKAEPGQSDGIYQIAFHSSVLLPWQRHLDEALL